MARRLKKPRQALARFSKAEAKRQHRARAQVAKVQAAAKARPKLEREPKAHARPILSRVWQRILRLWGRA